MPRAEAVLLMFTFPLYALGFALPLFAVVTGRDRPMAVGRWAALAGLLAHTGAIVARSIAAGHVPIATPYENATTGAWFVMLLTFLAPRRWGLYRSAGMGASALALLLLGWGTVTQDASAGPMAASLKSVWLVVHVLFAMLAYGAFSVASGASIGYLMKARRGESGVLARLPPLEALDRIAYAYVVFGFITCAVMIAAGSIWAKDLWGAYWSWDPVEMWSLVAWVVYGILIHLRVTYGWHGRRFAWFAVFAVAFMFVAYFGVDVAVNASRHVFTIPAQ